MNKFSKALLTASIINIGLFLLGFVEPTLFLVFLGFVVIEFFGGLLMLLDPASRETAAGIMVAAGITFLIGFSICSTMSFNLH